MTCSHCHNYPPGQCPCPCHDAKKAVVVLVEDVMYSAYITRFFFEYYARFYPQRLRVAHRN